jgi:two-component system, chemotaxis family, protein-glutamate methylesterase/glutaminase
MRAKPEAIVIGASAGAITALSTIFPHLAPDFPLPVFVVVHIPPNTKSILPEIFAPKCRIKIKEAEDKEAIVPGTVYFAPPDYHLLVESNGSLSLSSDEQEIFSRPAINVLFESAADAYGEGLVAVLLTGASHDGTRGLRAVMDAGGRGIIQDPSTAEVQTMPEAALAVCPEIKPTKLEDIGPVLAGLEKDLKIHAE